MIRGSGVEETCNHNTWMEVKHPLGFTWSDGSKEAACIECGKSLMIHPFYGVCEVSEK